MNTLLFIVGMLLQQTIPSSLEEHALVPEKAKIGESFCVIDVFGSRERHAWVYREYFYKSDTNWCLRGARMTRTNAGWLLQLDGAHIRMTTMSDSDAMRDAIMATRIEVKAAQTK